MKVAEDNSMRHVSLTIAKVLQNTPKYFPPKKKDFKVTFKEQN